MLNVVTMDVSAPTVLSTRQIIFFSKNKLGGADDIEHLPVSNFARGVVGCVGQLSVGQLFDVDLLKRASDGRNVDSCQDEADESFLLNVP